MKYEWFRSYHGAPTDPKWLVIANRAKVPVHLVSAIVWALLDYASNNPDRGNIGGFDCETLATFYGCDERCVTDVTQSLRDKNIIDKNLYFAKWEELQGDENHRPLTPAQRMKSMRERKKQEALLAQEKTENGDNSDYYKDVTPRNNVTERYEDVTELRSVTTIEIEKENKKDSDDDNARVREIFKWLEEFFNSPLPYHSAPVNAWLNWNADFELDIKPVAERYKKRKQEPPRSLSWLDEDIAKSIKQRNKPIPETPLPQGIAHLQNSQPPTGGNYEQRFAKPTKDERLRAAVRRAAIAGGFAD